MLPRPARPHDQLLRALWVAGIGGLVAGHVLWLAGISLATSTTNVSTWVLVVAVVSFVLGAAAAALGWRSYQHKGEVWAAFLWALPVSPVLLSLAVLGITYL
jgi:uncharacterized membrane protein YoaK (UPF0700 family)